MATFKLFYIFEAGGHVRESTGRCQTTPLGAAAMYYVDAELGRRAFPPVVGRVSRLEQRPVLKYTLDAVGTKEVMVVFFAKASGGGR